MKRYMKYRYGEDLGIENGSLNVPVLYIDYIAHIGHNVNDPLTDSEYEILNHFENLEIVAIGYTTEDDFDVQATYDMIQKYYPGVRVYDAREMTFVNED